MMNNHGRQVPGTIPPRRRPSQFANNKSSTVQEAAAAESLPDIMDLISPMEQVPVVQVQPSSSSSSSSSEPQRKVVLEKRAGVAAAAAATVIQQKQVEETNVNKKAITSAELNRMRINAASEYYRKLREGPPPATTTQESTPAHAETPPVVAVPNSSSSSGVPIGPPPPLIPTTNCYKISQQQQQPETSYAYYSPTATAGVLQAGNSQLSSSAPVPVAQAQQAPNYTHLTLSPPPSTEGQQSRQTQQPQKPNIDLGALVRSTIINGVTKVFSQVHIILLIIICIKSKNILLKNQKSNEPIYILAIVLFYT
jgi:hypothetical protein